jgi:hypothetical protein
MARDADGIFDSTDKWADSGSTGVPPFARTAGWGLTYSQEGGDTPERLVFNLLFLELFALGIDINKMGSALEYNATIDYVVGASVFGTDGILYKAHTANGPASSVVSPIADATGVWCYANAPAPGTISMLSWEPSATQLVQMRILEGNGASVLDADYPDILTAWGSKIYGNVDGTHFYLPELSGRLFRVWDDNVGNDPGASVDFTGDTHSNTTVDGIADTSILEVGMLVTGTDMAAGTTIVSIDSGTAITISIAATGTTVGASLNGTNRTDRGDGTTGDEIGTLQANGNLSHTHTEQWIGGSGAFAASGANYTRNDGFASGGLDARPNNITVFAGVHY